MQDASRGEGVKGVNVILLGPPGAGKGTQAELLSKRWKLAHISTGDLLRKAVQAKTKLGLQAKSFIDRGTLVPDDVVVALIRETLPRSGGFLLDGFPRTIEQAQALVKMLDEEGRRIDRVINFSVDEDIVTQRLTGRGRSDDTPETVRMRLEVYRKETEPLIAYYQKQGKLRSVDGSGTVEAVSRAIDAELKAP